MALPKYDFYLGEQYNKLLLLLYEVGGGYISTVRYVELKSEYLFIDKIFKKSTARITYYDENETYLGFYPLYSAANRVISVAPGSKYMTISFEASEENLQPYVSDEYGEDHFADFVYAVYPCNPVYKALSKKLSKESNQEFFRETLEGNISLHGEDFLKVYSASLDTKFSFLVFRKGSLFFKDYFAKTSCTFDYEKKICKPKLAKEDQYSSIMNKYDTVYNLYNLRVPTSQINITKRPAIQLYVAGSQRVTTVLDGAFWESEVIEEQINEFELDTKYHFVKKASIGEYQFELKNGSSGTIAFSGSFDNEDMSMSGRNRQYCCYLKKVANKGSAFEGPYSAYEYTLAQDLYTRDEKQSYTSLATGASFFAEDSYVIRIVNSENQKAWESEQLFHVNSSYFKVLGVGPAVNFKSTTEGYTDTGSLEVIGVNPVFARLICDVETITTPNGNTYNTYEIPYDDFVQDNRNYKRCYGIDFGDVLSTFAFSDKPTRYGQDDAGLYFTRPSSGAGLNVIPLDQSQWINSALWYSFSEYYPELDQAASKKYYLKDAYHIADVIQCLLNKIAPGLQHKATAEYSQFLYGESNPIRVNKIALFMTQKTNILKGEYAEAAKKVEVSLEDVMEMLQKCFKCYFWVEDNKLRIEHISWFQNGGSYDRDIHKVGLNLKDRKDKFNKMWAGYFQSEITYDVQDLSARYSFQYMDDQTEVFSDVSFEVDANYVEASKSEDITVSNFAVDIDYMLISPNSFSEEGFALIGAVLEEGKYTCPVVSQSLTTEEGHSYTVRVQNGYLSWPQLLSYYMYDLPALSLTGSFVKDLMPVSTMRFMQHEIKIPLPDGFNIQNSIATALGEGVVRQANIDLTTQVADITLEYSPA